MLTAVFGLSVFTAIIATMCWIKLNIVASELESMRDASINRHNSVVDLSFSLARATSADVASEVRTELSRILENTAKTSGKLA